MPRFWTLKVSFVVVTNIGVCVLANELMYAFDGFKPVRWSVRIAGAYPPLRICSTT
jgi:hypothetical protein